MINKRISKPELLLPAGDGEAVRAAVQNGADAVYLGGKQFSARQNAKNFSEDGLREAVSYCHARGVKVYQTLNTLVFDTQLDEVAQAVRQGCSCGIDAFIVQDWGVFALIRSLCPQMRLHASTQMTVHTPRGAALLREMGASRVVLARELSLEEIRAITEQVDVETEVFVHGALCMSVSGQCYLSGMIGGRSGNRGCCAGSCRLPFSPDRTERYALSLKDNCLTGHLQELAQAGVTSLKIEGRMKRPEYVAAAARAYAEEQEGKPADMQTLRAVFSRSGFTDAYFTGNIGPDMFGIRQKEDVTAATAKLLKGLENTYQKEKGRIPLDMQLHIRAGEPVRLYANDPDGHRVEAIGAEPEPAVNRPLRRKELSERLGKLGGTIFLPGKVEIWMEEGLSLPVSVINELRRAVCTEILASRSEIRPVPCNGSLPALPEPQKADRPLAYAARYARYAQVDETLLPQWEWFSLPLDEAEAHAGSLSAWKDKLLLEPGRALFGGEGEVFESLARLKKLGFWRIFCNNIAHLQMARALSMEAVGGPFLNVTNSLSAAELARLGIGAQTLSFEMNLSDAQAIRAPIPLGLLIYGYLPLMLLRSCPLRGLGACRDCGGSGWLTDRKGKRFRVSCGGNRRYAELYNADLLWMAERQKELAGLSFGIFYFTSESREECARVLEQYRRGEAATRPFTRGLYYRNI